MSLQDKIKSRLKPVETGAVNVLGETFAIRLITQEEYKSQKFNASADADVMEFLAKEYLDPETMKPAFTVEFLSKELPYANVMELLRMYFRVQNGGTVEAAEKK